MKIVFALLVAWLLLPAARPNYDLVIRNGRVVDGTGAPAFYADIGVNRGKIAEIRRGLASGKNEVDAAGQIVTPGYIDVHTHSESIGRMPEAENFIRMGVTTIVTGNCGGSAPDIAKFLRDVEKTGTTVNVATLVGHNTVRSRAMGGSFDRAPTSAELEKMRAAVDRAMKDGAVGLSTGLIYLPGTFSKTDEIVEAAKALAPYDGIYVSHMRNEGMKMREALEEVFRIAREAGVRAHVSHIKRTGKPSWGTAGEMIALLEKARREGVDVSQDQYAYTASSTGIGANLIPAWAREGGREKYLERIAEPASKARLVKEMREELALDQREDFAFAVITSFGSDPSLNGKNIVEAAKLKRGSASVEDQIELILEIEKTGGAGGVFHEMNEEDLRSFLRHPNTMVASDSGPRRLGNERPHPRGFGNNARVLARYVRETGLLRLEEAVRRMTSLPAGVFRLRDRGILKEGAWADLVALNPDQIQDTATFDDPNQYPSGITAVVVNGEVAFQKGALSGKRPGKALRRKN